MKRLIYILALLVIGTFTIQAQVKVSSDTLLCRADKLFDEKDYEAAVKLYKEASTLGNSDAQNKLGFCYMYGTGIPKNSILAVNCFRRAAEKGYAKAQFNLANCYYMGRGIAISFKKSAEWMLKAAQQDYEPALQNIATYYKQGIGVMINNELSDAWSEKWKTVSLAEMTNESIIGSSKTMQRPSTDAPIQIILSAPVVPKDSIIKTVNIESSLKSVAKDPFVQPSTTHPKVDNHVEASTSVGLEIKVPEIKILYPNNQSLFHEESMTIKYQLLDCNWQDTKVIVMIDGIRQPVNRAVKAADMVEIDLPKKDCAVMLMAQNKYGYGAPASIQLIWDKSYDDVVLPNLYVLSIGISKYRDSKLPVLKYSVKDATDIVTALSHKKGKPYGNVQVKLICDEEATRSAIFDGLTWLKEHATPNDVCIFFYAGHGYRDEKNRFFFMPIDGISDKTYTCFSANDFRTMAEDIRGKLIVFTDACYSAALMEGNRSVASDHFIEQLRRTRDGLFLIASSAADTKSKEDDSWNNGAFTKALVEAINGAARRENNESLTLMDLQLYLDKRVGELTNHKQVPVAINPSGIENFSIFLYDEK